MKTGSMYCSSKKNCKVCRKLTGDYKTFEQSNMRLEIPMCDEHWKEQELVLTSIEFKTEIFLKEINKIIAKNKSK